MERNVHLVKSAKNDVLVVENRDMLFQRAIEALEETSNEHGIGIYVWRNFLYSEVPNHNRLELTEKSSENSNIIVSL